MVSQKVWHACPFQHLYLRDICREHFQFHRHRAPSQHVQMQSVGGDERLINSSTATSIILPQVVPIDTDTAFKQGQASNIPRVPIPFVRRPVL